MSIVSTDWLRENHSKVKIIDSSWHMPYANRNAFNEYNKEHIENAIFFDIDKNSNKKTFCFAHDDCVGSLRDFF